LVRYIFKSNSELLEPQFIYFTMKEFSIDPWPPARKFAISCWVCRDLAFYDC